MNIQSVRFAVPTCRLCVAACRRQRLQRECVRILYGGAIRATFETGGKAVVGLAAGTEYPAVKFDLAETFHRKCLPFAFSDGLLSLKGRLKT